MSLEVKTFNAEHLIDLMNVDETVARRAVMAEENMRRGGLGYSAILDGRCIGCAWALYDGGKYTVWVHVTPDLLAHKVWFHRTARRLWQKVKDNAGGLPIQALCDTTIEKNVRWAKRFGFDVTPTVVMEVVR